MFIQKRKKIKTKSCFKLHVFQYLHYYFSRSLPFYCVPVIEFHCFQTFILIFILCDIVFTTRFQRRHFSEMISNIVLVIIWVLSLISITTASWQLRYCMNGIFLGVLQISTWVYNAYILDAETNQ